MNLDEFGAWMTDHPKDWRSYTDRNLDTSALPGVPRAYADFLKRFGCLLVFDRVFLDAETMRETGEFVRSLTWKDEDFDYDQLIPFLSLGYDNCYLCFYNGRVVDFDPLDFVTPVADSFEEFLGRFIEGGGEQFWLAG